MNTIMALLPLLLPLLAAITIGRLVIGACKGTIRLGTIILFVAALVVVSNYL